MTIKVKLVLSMYNINFKNIFDKIVLPVHGKCYVCWKTMCLQKWLQWQHANMVQLFLGIMHLRIAQTTYNAAGSTLKS